MGSRKGLLIGALLTASCAKYTTYGYEYKMEQAFAGAEDAESPTVEARRLLAGAKTVAFFPPTICYNTRPEDLDKKRQQELRANCGTLMSALERAAESAGYEVLSWQNLRGEKRAIEYAREANVDVLFEVNEIERDSLKESDVKHTISFFEEGDGSETPVNVAETKAQQCMAYAGQAPRDAIRTGSIDIKTVAVADGRDRWHYRVTKHQSCNLRPKRELFTGRNTNNKAGTVLGPLGIVSAIVGGSLVTVEQLKKDDPLTPESEQFDTGGLSYVALIGGIALLGAGIALEVVVGGSKPDPATTLCDARFFVPPQVPTGSRPDPFASQHTFQQHTGTDDSPCSGDEEAWWQHMQGELITDFIQVLKDARKQAPPPAPAAPPAPPAAPAPAQP